MLKVSKIRKEGIQDTQDIQDTLLRPHSRVDHTTRRYVQYKKQYFRPFTHWPDNAFSHRPHNTAPHHTAQQNRE